MNNEDAAEQCLQENGFTDADFEEIRRQIDAEDRQAISITESPVWKDPQFVDKLARDFAAKDLEKSRETTKHYVDSPGQPARAPNISKMGNPKKGADGRVLRDARGLVIWDSPASAEQQQNRRLAEHLRNVHASGELFPDNCANCSSYGSQANPCAIVGAAIEPNTVICDKFKAKQGTKNMRADGKIDPTKSIMGNPVRQADGSVKWVSN